MNTEKLATADTKMNNRTLPQEKNSISNGHAVVATHGCHSTASRRYTPHSGDVIAVVSSIRAICNILNNSNGYSHS